MKILYVNHYGKTISGAERVMLNLAKGLRETHGVSITAICPSGMLADEFHGMGIETHVVEVVKFRRTTNPLFWANAAGSAASIWSKVYSLAGKGRYDLLFSNSFVAHLYTALPAKPAGLPAVWHMHDMLKPLAVNRRIVPFASSQATAIIAVSDAVKQTLVELGADEKKIVSILNGMDLAAFDESAGRGIQGEFPEKKAGEIFVAMVGQISTIKGQKQFVEAATDLLRERKEKLKFLVIGDTQDETDEKYKEKLLRDVENSGASENILFLGRRNDVPAILSNCDILVHASPSSDSCPMAVLEYLYAGKPVVASRIGGAPELITDGENGLLFEPGNATQLKNRLHGLLDNPQLGNKMAAAGKQRILLSHTLEAHTAKVYAALEGAVRTL